jgi:iron(III) transport system ATP-binding protein
MTRVRCEQITKRFGDIVALDAVTLDVAPGELFFLLGPSGCGKSTLLRLIAGLLSPTGGRIRFDDRDVTALGTEQRNAVMCFQSYALWPHLTVRENVRFGLDVRGLGRADQRQRVDEVLRLVQMSAYAARKPNELSGGQQQRVALARALVVTPACLLLDEPLSNLDARLRLDMRGEIRRICKDTGVTTVYVTHEQKEALSIADRVAILDRGRIEQIGAPRDVYLRPASRFVAGFIGETNLLAARVVKREAARVELSTPLGPLISTALPEGPLAAGDDVTVSIRPESIVLGAPAGANSATAVLRGSVYLGEIAQHSVAVEPIAPGSIGVEPITQRSVTAEPAAPRQAGASAPSCASAGPGDLSQPGPDAASPAGGTLLKVFELNPRFAGGPDRLERTTVWVDPDDVVVLTR